MNMKIFIKTFLILMSVGIKTTLLSPLPTIYYSIYNKLFIYLIIYIIKIKQYMLSFVVLTLLVYLHNYYFIINCKM